MKWYWRICFCFFGLFAVYEPVFRVPSPSSQTLSLPIVYMLVGQLLGCAMIGFALSRK